MLDACQALIAATLDNVTIPHVRSAFPSVRKAKSWSALSTD
jgi:hypothetical protein